MDNLRNLEGLKDVKSKYNLNTSRGILYQNGGINSKLSRIFKYLDSLVTKAGIDFTLKTRIERAWKMLGDLN